MSSTLLHDIAATETLTTMNSRRLFQALDGLNGLEAWRPVCLVPEMQEYTWPRERWRPAFPDELVANLKTSKPNLDALSFSAMTVRDQHMQ